MRGRIAGAIVILSILALPLIAQGKNEIVKIGPALSFGNFKDLSNVQGLLTGALPGGELAVRLAKRVEAWGAYKFSKTAYRLGHGYDRIFRLDAFAVGARYKPVGLRDPEPFVGIGLNCYHFTDDDTTPFVFPVSSAIGPFVQGGFYFRFLSWLQGQCACKYNLMKHTEKRTTDLGTYHYRIDFSGLEFSVGLMFCISGRQQKGGL